MPLNGKNEQGNVVALKLQDFGCSELIAWMLFLWKGFLRHSFITKMLTKLKPQEQARKLEMFTHSKAYKNNPFPFSGQKCRELQQCTSPCQGTWGSADQKGGKTSTRHIQAASASLSVCYCLMIIGFRFLTATSKSCWPIEPLGWENFIHLSESWAYSGLSPSICMA